MARGAKSLPQTQRLCVQNPGVWSPPSLSSPVTRRYQERVRGGELGANPPSGPQAGGKSSGQGGVG